MKKIILGSMTAALAFAATPATAQSVNGVVNITANVPGKCQVVSPGPAGSSFASTVDLGDISAADGTLLPSATLAALFNAGGSQTANLEFQVVCNTAAPFVTVDADPIVSVTPAGTGYANRVDYIGTVRFDTIPGSTTVNSASTSATAVSTALNGRLATGGSNVTVTASNFATPNATDVLVAGAYAGVINITIAPAP